MNSDDQTNFYDKQIRMGEFVWLDENHVVGRVRMAVRIRMVEQIWKVGGIHKNWIWVSRRKFYFKVLIG